jgi:hypothetical protein
MTDKAFRPKPVFVLEATKSDWPLKLMSVEEPVVVVEKLRLPKILVEASCVVELACKPFWNQIAVEVLLAVAPKLVVGVQLNVPPPEPQSLPVPDT